MTAQGPPHRAVKRLRTHTKTSHTLMYCGKYYESAYKPPPRGGARGQSPASKLQLPGSAWKPAAFTSSMSTHLSEKGVRLAHAEDASQPMHSRGNTTNDKRRALAQNFWANLAPSNIFLTLRTKSVPAGDQIPAAIWGDNSLSGRVTHCGPSERGVGLVRERTQTRTPAGPTRRT
jgi:hypothetical protein